jgi:hypothetical protein
MPMVSTVRARELARICKTMAAHLHELGDVGGARLLDRQSERWMAYADRREGRVKLCKDCRWIGPRGSDLRDAECKHPDAAYTETSPVDGTERRHRWGCEIMRASDTLPCGVDGKLWEPNEEGPPPTGFV